jgi:hypothetical protein
MAVDGFQTLPRNIFAFVQGFQDLGLRVPITVVYAILALNITKRKARGSPVKILAGRIVTFDPFS